MKAIIIKSDEHFEMDINSIKSITAISQGNLLITKHNGEQYQCIGVTFK